MSHKTLRLLSVMLALQCVPGMAQQDMVPGHAHELAIQTFAAASKAHLTVTTPSFSNGAQIPHESTQFGGNVFPGLQWSAGPQGTQSYAVIVQGQRTNDAHAVTSIHFTVFDIPASVT